jgi:hypothetical protein
MHINLTFASNPTSTSSLPHASIDADVPTNLIITFSIGFPNGRSVEIFQFTYCHRYIELHRA